jgi:transcriptional regulator with XRE-family HTH domain
MPRAASVAELVGRKLRALRKLRGYSQEQLGERAKVSGKFVGMVERGDGNPTLDVLIRLAGALKVEPWELLHIEETRAEGPPRNAARGFAAAERVSSYLSRRAPEEVERALKILEAALGEDVPRVR